MIIKKVKAFYFSPTGSTAGVVLHMAQCLAEHFQVPMESFDFTLPAGRKTDFHTSGQDLAVFGLPTYAGRIPNKILPYVQKLFQGDGSPTVALVTFGNRNFDSSLTELKEELGSRGFRVFAAGAFICEHVFSSKIGGGRPDREDLDILKEFAGQCAGKLDRAAESSDLTIPVIRGGEGVQPYYRPLGIDGQPAVFLKAKPLTDPDLCSQCGICAQVCPMGSIDHEDYSVVSGICIKCQACIKKCPDHAKYFDDPAFLSHVAMLEKNYLERKEPEYYL